MKQQDFNIHSQIHQRVVERYKATPEPNPLVLEILTMLSGEYAVASQIFPVDPD